MDQARRVSGAVRRVALLPWDDLIEDFLARALGARARARVESAFSLAAIGGRLAALLAGGS